MSSCVINLDNYQGPYKPGDVIRGNVICSFNSTENIRGIILTLKGEEYNQWRVYKVHYSFRRKTSRGKIVRYQGRETFLSTEHCLQELGNIGPGKFKYPFTIQLPRVLPNSYQGRYGGVCFTLEVKVDRPYKFDYTDKKQIEVSSLIDLNLMKNKLQLKPTVYSVEKTLCCWCCRSNPLTMEVHLEKEAFVVGEVVKIRVDITNMSNEKVEKMFVKLRREIECMVTRPENSSKYDYKLLAVSSAKGVQADGELTCHFALKIPESSQIHNFNLCQLFSERTKLEVIATLPGCHINLKAVVHVIVGHIPIDGFQDSALPSNSQI